jgi:hypothetical protein
LQGGQAQIEEKHIKDARPIFSSTGGEDLARVSKVYESDFGNVALWANADGDIGIGTEATPHGGIGWAKLAIDGVDFDEAGPHMQFTTDADDYPVIQIFPWGHDENGINFDSYYDGAWKSSTTDQNFQILATGGRLRFRYDSGVAAGAALSWNEGIALRTDGTVGIGTITPGAKLESVSSTGAQLRLSHTTASKFLDITVNTTHDATFKPSSTGQIIFQPTTDQTNFLQVLDADGGNPVLNVDATNERVGFGTAAPTATVDAIRRDAAGTVFRMENTVGIVSATFVNGSSKSWAFGVLAGASGGFAITEIGVASQFFVNAGGNVGIGIATALAKTHIDQASTTAATPVLSLDQADLSEEFINFITTIGAGNPLDTAAIGTYYGKARVAVNGTFKYVALYNS